MIANLHFVKQLGRDSKDALEDGDLQQFGELMNTHWEYKKGRSQSMSNDRINHWYDLARKNGALGGKLIGAGGGGFLMFLCQEGSRVRQCDDRGGAGRGPVPVRLRRHEGGPSMSRLPVAILAGGLATRLGALTRKTPKCLLEVAGRPFIHHQLRQLAKQGVSRVILCLGHLGEQVVEAVGDGSAFGLEVAYSFDGPDLRGTAGAVKRALPLLGAGVLRPLRRLLPECSYAAVQHAFEAAGKLALMTVFRNEGQWDTSNVEFHDGRILAYDKLHRTPGMQYIDYGLGVWDHRAFDVVPGRERVIWQASARRCWSGTSSRASR